MITRKTTTILLFVAAGVIAALLLILSLNISKTDTEMMNNYKEETLNDVPQAQWDALGQKTVFFGHMSVGLNIVEGMEALLRQNSQIPIRISETEAPHTFIHARLGSNTRPLEKIASFQSQIRQLQSPPDIAFLKFCYVDFYAATDITPVFEAYKKMIAELQAEFPNTLFMHCTVPLTSNPLNTKDTIKNIIKPFFGKSNAVADNQKRLEFSTLLKETYPPDTIIDIEFAESTTPEGMHCFKVKNGTQVPFLLKEYTTDGGHLNEAGSKRVAEYLLVRLAEAVGSE